MLYDAVLYPSSPAMMGVDGGTLNTSKYSPLSSSAGSGEIGVSAQQLRGANVFSVLPR